MLITKQLATEQEVIVYKRPSRTEELDSETSSVSTTMNDMLLGIVLILVVALGLSHIMELPNQTMQQQSVNTVELNQGQELETISPIISYNQESGFVLMSGNETTAILGNNQNDLELFLQNIVAENPTARVKPTIKLNRNLPLSIQDIATNACLELDLDFSLVTPR